ncbi:hypothetical protein Golob_002831, partial [Gossypium lobatum]|nr:hypothetical protein [Gossypium lobatum]
VDLVPTVEEYTTLLHCLRIQVDKSYSRAANVLTFLKRLMSITGMSEQWSLQDEDVEWKAHWMIPDEILY